MAATKEELAEARYEAAKSLLHQIDGSIFGLERSFKYPGVYVTLNERAELALLKKVQTMLVREVNAAKKTLEAEVQHV